MATYSCKVASVSPAGDSQVNLTIEQRLNAGDANPIRTFTITVPKGATNAEARAAVAANIAADEAAKAAAQAQAADAVGRFAALVGVGFNVTA